MPTLGSQVILPEVFQGTKFANTCYASNPDIIRNRIDFKEEFKIVDAVPPPNPITGENSLRGDRFKNEVNPEYPYNFTFDHFEFYEREGDLGYVAIFSPYHDVSPSDEYYEQVNQLGYKKYRMSLYCLPSEGHSCPTYILLVPKENS
tara:strand:+ start:133 stop:573 length:441 start_codon:yes stop_codon:yes gene_type:complete